jgi:hypothetical protein
MLSSPVQAAHEYGLRFPCPLMNLVSAIGLIVWAYPIWFRSCKAIVVLKPQLRKRYMRYFSNQAMRRQGALVITTTVVIWASTTAFALCYHPEL